MPKTPDPDQYSEKETAKRMENALRHALTTPHKSNKDFIGKKGKSPARKPKKSAGLHK
jgi:hypothetical protein